MNAEKYIYNWSKYSSPKRTENIQSAKIKT